MQYWYVEKFVEIPAQWEENARKVCPRLRLGHLFHYNAFQQYGWMVYNFSFYFWKAQVQGTDQQMEFYMKEGEEEYVSSWPEFMIKAPIFATVDFIIRDRLPILVCGTKDVGVYTEWIFKNGLETGILGWIYNSKWLDQQIKSIASLCGGKQRVKKVKLV